jgi:hypothetical protein
VIAAMSEQHFGLYCIFIQPYFALPYSRLLIPINKNGHCNFQI